MLRSITLFGYLKIFNQSRMSLNPKVTSAVLVRLDAGSDERLISLGRPLTVVGSKGHARLRLLSSEVSGSHAVLLNIANNYFIRDLMSRAGVLVNEQPVRETRLKYGDVIGIGNFRFRFEDAGLLRQPPMQFRALPGALHLAGQSTPVRLDSMLFIIGRHEGANLVLEGQAVSKAHAIVFEHIGQRLIRDLASRHGTFVNGEQIRESVLRDGDLIRIGNNQLRYTQLMVRQESSEATTAEHRIVADIDSETGSPPLQLESTSETVSTTESANFTANAEIPEEDSESACIVEGPHAAKTAAIGLSGTIDDVGDLEQWGVFTGSDPLLADSPIDPTSDPSDPHGLSLTSDVFVDEAQAETRDDAPQQSVTFSEGARPTEQEGHLNGLKALSAQNDSPAVSERSRADAEGNTFLQPAGSLATLVRPKETMPLARPAPAAEAKEARPSSAAPARAGSRGQRPIPRKLKNPEQLAAILGPEVLSLSGSEMAEDEHASEQPRRSPRRAVGVPHVMAFAAVVGFLALIAAGAWFYLRRH